MELIYLLPRLPPSRRRLEDSSNPQFRLPTPPDAATVTPLSSSSTSSSSPLRSPHRLPPRDNIAAAVVNASSSSTRPLSPCLPPDIDRARGNRRHIVRQGSSGHGPLLPRTDREWRRLPRPCPPPSRCDGLLTDAAAALPASCRCRCHCRRRHAATALPTEVLPPMTPRCRRAAKLATATALPSRCCR